MPSGGIGGGVSLAEAASVNPEASMPLSRVKATDLVRLGSGANLASLVISHARSYSDLSAGCTCAMRAAVLDGVKKTALTSVSVPSSLVRTSCG